MIRFSSKKELADTVDENRFSQIMEAVKTAKLDKEKALSVISKGPSCAEQHGSTNLTARKTIR